VGADPEVAVDVGPVAVAVAGPAGPAGLVDAVPAAPAGLVDAARAVDVVPAVSDVGDDQGVKKKIQVWSSVL